MSRRHLRTVTDDPDDMGMEAALQVTLRAWQQRQHLAGDAHAAQRAALRAAFAAADRARAAADDGTMTEYAVVLVVRTAAELLRACAPVAAADPLDELLQQLP